MVEFKFDPVVASKKCSAGMQHPLFHSLFTTESAVANTGGDTPAMPAGGAPGMGGMM